MGHDIRLYFGDYKFGEVVKLQFGPLDPAQNDVMLRCEFFYLFV